MCSSDCDLSSHCKVKPSAAWLSSTGVFQGATSGSYRGRFGVHLNHGFSDRFDVDWKDYISLVLCVSLVVCVVKQSVFPDNCPAVVFAEREGRGTNSEIQKPEA